MKKENRGTNPLAGITVAAILLASTAGYVSALSRMFESPMPIMAEQSDFHLDAVEEARAAATQPVSFSQSLSRTAPAWFMNAMPAYSSGRAREMWYLSLNSSSDNQSSSEFYGGRSEQVRGGYLLFDRAAFTTFGATTYFVSAGGERSSAITAPNAPLASGSWNANASDVWSNSARWLGGVIADGAGSTGNFLFNISATRTITIDGAVASRTLGIVNIGDTDGGNNYTIAASGGGTLTFDNGGSNAQINQVSTSANNTISAPILLKGSLDISNASAGQLTISGPTSSSATSGTQTITLLSGTALIGSSAAAIISDGSTGGQVAVAVNAGTLTLQTSTNTYSGGTFVNGGILTFNQSGSLGTGTVTLGKVGGGNAQLTTSNATANPTNNIVVTAGTGGTSILGSTSVGTVGGSIYSGTITLNGDVTATSSYAGTAFLTFSNTISGVGKLTKVGPGILLLSGNNTYTGATQIDAGTLNAGSTNALGGTSNVTVNTGGTLLLSNSGTTNRINDSATMTLNGGTFNTGGLSEHGVNNNDAGIGALTLQSSSIIDLGSGASILAFANSSSQTWTGTLSIYNWSGTAVAGNGTDQLYFGTDTTGLTASQLSQISFYSDAGTTFLGFGSWGTDLDGEVVPVPEPSTWIGAGLALAAVGFTQRRKIRGLIASRA